MFTGEFPEVLATHAKLLEHLELQNNALSGTLPYNIWVMQSVTSLDISYNQISGDFETIWYLPLLSTLDISNNHFAGTINPAVM